MNNTTFFGCNYSFAKDYIGVRTEDQGFILIGYAFIQFILLIIFSFQNYQMITYSVYKRLRFLYISNCLFLGYLICKLIYSLEDIAFCADYTEWVWIDIVTFELFIIPINFFNLSVCESLLMDCPTYYYRAIKKLKCIKLVSWYFLFPIIGLQFGCYLINMLTIRWEIIPYIDFSLRIIFFVSTIIIFIECSGIFRFLFNKNDKIKLITAKHKFFCFYIILIAAFLVRLIWTLIIFIQTLVNPSRSDWFEDLRIKCFENGSLSALIIETCKMFIIETLVLCVISIILYRDTNKKFKTLL